MTTEKKVAFISGANRGIGLETARALGKLGITVLLGSRDPQKGEAAAAELRAEGLDARFVAFDAADRSAPAALAAAIGKEFGKLDILVNNAGILIEPWFVSTTATISEDDLRKTFDINFFAVVAVTQALLPLILKAPAGRIVNVSSILGSLGAHAAQPSPIDAVKGFAYNASKTAVNAFTVHLAQHLRGTRAKVNSAHPGWVKTELGTSQAPVEVADGALTSVRLATLPDDGPNGGFFENDQVVPW